MKSRIELYKLPYRSTCTLNAFIWNITAKRGTRDDVKSILTKPRVLLYRLYLVHHASSKFLKAAGAISVYSVKINHKACRNAIYLLFTALFDLHEVCANSTFQLFKSYLANKLSKINFCHKRLNMNVAINEGAGKQNASDEKSSTFLNAYAQWSQTFVLSFMQHRFPFMMRCSV